MRWRAFTLALGSNDTVGLAGFITGVSATLSMAASEYLSKKAEPGEKHPLKAAVYTGIAYMITVALLASAVRGVFLAVSGAAVLPVQRGLHHLPVHLLSWRWFVENPSVRSSWKCLPSAFGVAAISFFIGWAAKTWNGHRHVVRF